MLEVEGIRVRGEEEDKDAYGRKQWGQKDLVRVRFDLGGKL